MDTALTQGDFDMSKVMMPMIGIMMLVVVMQMFQPPSPPPGRYGCPYCDATFDTIEELITHISEAHPDKPPLQLVDITWE